jgi:AraC-like DNA-binding protein
VDLAAAAVTAGYADQAHLTRECRALSGMTPAVGPDPRVRLAPARAAGLTGMRLPVSAAGAGQAASGGSPIIAVPMVRKPSLE